MSATLKMWKRRLGVIKVPFTWYGAHVKRFLSKGVPPVEWIIALVIIGFYGPGVVSTEKEPVQEPEKVIVKTEAKAEQTPSPYTGDLDAAMTDAINQSKDPECMRKNLKLMAQGRPITKNDLNRQVVYCDMRWEADEPARERARQQSLLENGV